MIAHGEDKGCTDVPGGSKKRDAIVFLPILIFDEGRADAGRNQLLDLRGHTLAFIAHHEIDGFDSRAR